MSSPLAALRRHPSHSLSETAQRHLENDLSSSDREALRTAASRVSTHATIGSLVGLGLGLLLAFRVRANRVRMFEAFRAAEKPVQVVFDGGRTEPIPDVTPLVRPSFLGDFAAYTLFSAGGVFLGGEMGFLTGSYSGAKAITKDPESRQRIEEAFRKFRIDLVRQELAELEKGRKAGLEGLLGSSENGDVSGGLWS